MAGPSHFLSALALLFSSAAGFRKVVRSDKVACSDTSTSCGYWADQGFCLQSSQYYAWMAENCCASCSSGPAPAPGTCGFVNRPVEVQNNVGTGYRSFIYTEPYRAEFLVDGLLLRDAAFQNYTQWLTATMAMNFADVDPFDQTALLIRQRGVFERHGYDTWDWDVMLGGKVGAITEANCIESALWAKQNEHHPLSEEATEFGAYILLDSALTTVKIYLQTGPMAGVPGMSWAVEPINLDMSNGFKMLTFLHNHPFFAHQPGGLDCAGTCVPSSADLRAYASTLQSNAQSFWVTNGHDSFRFPNSELGMFTPATTAVSALETERVQKERPEGPLDLLLKAQNGSLVELHEVQAQAADSHDFDFRRFILDMVHTAIDTAPGSPPEAWMPAHQVRILMQQGDELIEYINGLHQQLEEIQAKQGRI